MSVPQSFEGGNFSTMDGLRISLPDCMFHESSYSQSWMQEADARDIDGLDGLDDHEFGTHYPHLFSHYIMGIDLTPIRVC
jgi:hypothetical protein